jgi:molybdopterin converting factor small subunit
MDPAEEVPRLAVRVAWSAAPGIAEELTVELPVGATLLDALRASGLRERCPALASGRPHVRFARNGVYADADEPLSDGDEVAFIPPVSGGAGNADEPVRELRLSEEPIDAAVVDSLQRVDMREFPRPGDRQDVITKDNVVVTVNATIFTQVVDAKAALFSVANYDIGIDALARTALRSVIGTMTLDEALSE